MAVTLLHGQLLLLVLRLDLHILVLDLDDVLLVLVDDGQQFAFDLGEVFAGLVLVEEVHLLLEDEVCVAGEVPERISISSTFFFFMVEFQWFLIELSVRPGSILVISAHLLPWAVCARNRIHSSCAIHSTFRMLGLRWLCHRSRHCLPSRPSTNFAMNDHRCGPYFSTNLRTKLSSCSVHGFLRRKRERALSDSTTESLLSSSGCSSSQAFLTMFKPSNLKITVANYILLNTTGRPTSTAPCYPVHYIIFEMENFSPLAPLSHHEFNPKEQEGLEKIFFRLKELHEVQDESRNELCPAFLDQESLHAHRRPSLWSNHPPHNNILKELEETGEHALQQPRSLPQTSKRNSRHIPTTQDLQLTNLKLRQDNTKLFNECLRLRTLCKNLQSGDFSKPTTRDAQLQRENAHLKNTIEQLSRDRDRLQLKVRLLSSELTDQQLLAQRCERISGEVELLSRVNQQLADKVVQLERELESSHSRFSSKSSQNGQNSTLESRRTDAEKDRMISNMKIVHESEIRKLKNMIEQMGREQKNSQVAGFSGVLSPRRK